MNLQLKKSGQDYMGQNLVGMHLLQYTDCPHPVAITTEQFISVKNQ